MKKIIVFIGVVTIAIGAEGQDLVTSIEGIFVLKYFWWLLVVILVLGALAAIVMYHVVDPTNQKEFADESCEQEQDLEAEKSIELLKCPGCNNDLKGGMNEEKKYVVLTCTHCGNTYHQYSGYGGFYLQSKPTKDSID